MFHHNEPSNFIPIFGVAWTVCTTFSTGAAGCASIGAVVEFTTFNAVPSEFIHGLGMIHTRRNIRIYSLALWAHYMGIPTGILKYFPTSTSDHLFHLIAFYYIITQKIGGSKSHRLKMVLLEVSVEKSLKRFAMTRLITESAGFTSPSLT